MIEAHQGVMTDRRHSLKRGDRLSKKERQTTASDWGKATNCDLCYGSKVTATFVTIKQATKQLQNEWQATWVTPLVGLMISLHYCEGENFPRASASLHIGLQAQVSRLAQIKK